MIRFTREAPCSETLVYEYGISFWLSERSFRCTGRKYTHLIVGQSCTNEVGSVRHCLVNRFQPTIRHRWQVDVILQYESNFIGLRPRSPRVDPLSHYSSTSRLHVDMCWTSALYWKDRAVSTVSSWASPLSLTSIQISKAISKSSSERNSCERDCARLYVTMIILKLTSSMYLSHSFPVMCSVLGQYCWVTRIAARICLTIPKVIYDYYYSY